MVRMMLQSKAFARSARAAVTVALIAIAGLGFAGLLPACDELPLKLEAKRLVEEAGGGATGGTPAGSTWTIQTVPSGDFTGISASMYLRNDEPRIAYIRNENFIDVISMNSGTWGLSENASGLPSAYNKSIALGVINSDRAYLSYVGGASEELYNSQRDLSSPWQPSNLGFGLGPVNGKIDQVLFADLPMIAYVSGIAGSEKAYYAVQFSSTVIQTGVGTKIAIAVDGSGVPHVIYSKTIDNSICYNNRNGGTWNHERTITTFRYMEDCDIAIAGGKIMCAFIDGDRGVLGYSESSDGIAWSSITEISGNAGSTCSLAIGPGSRPCISFYDKSATALKFAFRDSSSNWNTEIVDGATITDAGKYSSLAIDSLNHALIAYYESSSLRLKYAKRDLAL